MTSPVAVDYAELSLHRQHAPDHIGHQVTIGSSVAVSVDRGIRATAPEVHDTMISFQMEADRDRAILRPRASVHTRREQRKSRLRKHF